MLVDAEGVDTEDCLAVLSFFNGVGNKITHFSVAADNCDFDHF